MSAATTEVRTVASEARILVGDARADYDLPEGVSLLCDALVKLADAAALLCDDAESTQRVLASRTEHLA